MTTLEFLEKELAKCEINVTKQTKRNAPQENIENIKRKIGFYADACCRLRKGGAE